MAEGRGWGGTSRTRSNHPALACASCPSLSKEGNIFSHLFRHVEQHFPTRAHREPAVSANSPVTQPSRNQGESNPSVQRGTGGDSFLLWARGRVRVAQCFHTFAQRESHCHAGGYCLSYTATL